MKRLIVFVIVMLVSSSFSDNIIRRGVNNRRERIAATGDGSDTLPFTPGISITSPIDAVLSSVITIGPAHHEIHEGKHFYVKGFVDLINQDSLLFLFIVRGVPAHVFFIIKPQDGEGIITLYEGSTYSDSGDLCTSFNRDRGSANVATVTCTTDPTITDYGTAIYPAMVGSGKTFGGEIRGENEIIGDTITTYLLVLDNNTTSGNVIDYLVDWYEHVED
jgi:hypothetical protein